MRTLAVRCAAATSLLLPIAIGGAPAVAVSHQEASAYSCRFERTTGYVKLSPVKPRGRRNWTFELQLDHGSQRVTIIIDGKATTVPALFRHDDVLFTIPVQGRNERVSFDTEDLDFVMVADTTRARLQYLGVCEKVSS